MKTLDNLTPSAAVKDPYRGWFAETWVHVAPGLALKVSTLRNVAGDIVTTARAHRNLHDNDSSGLWTHTAGDYLFTLETLAGGRATEKTVNAAHARHVNKATLAAHVEAAARAFGVKP